MCGVFANAQQKKIDTTRVKTISCHLGYHTFKKGTVLLFWGWNRAAYTNSDIHFKGNGYNFILKKVKGVDRPADFDFNTYFNPGNVTLPQTNARIAYFYKNNMAIVLGLDHMKYVMKQNQAVDFEGHINNPVYATMVNNGEINLSNGDFLTFEHTDGLNYINIGLEKYKDLIQRKNIQLAWGYGAGLGALLPKTNAKLMGNERSDRFHLAGFGLDVRTNLNLVLWKHVLVRLEAKYGYINMPDIKTKLNNKPDKAWQDFAFGQINLGIGYTFNLKKKK